MNPPAFPAAVSIYDARPFFEKALQFGLQNGIIGSEKLDAICADAPKGMVQIARYFGNEFLRPDIEKARQRLINLVSLNLQSISGSDLRLAAELLCDHSFLSRSKGGSDMLKAMLALPESTAFESSLEGSDRPNNVPPKGLAEWSLKSFADYQAEIVRRAPVQLEKGAALWLAEHLGAGADELEEAHTHAEAVIRTALLVLSTKGAEMPDWLGFEKMLTALRKKSRPARTAASRTAGEDENAGVESAKPPASSITISIPKNLPAEFRPVVQAARQSVIDDVARIVNSTLPFRALFVQVSDDRMPPLLGRYFWLENMAGELEQHERSVSTDWEQVTGGNCDDGSLLTLFVCIAVGLPPKTLLSEKAATALVRKIQKAGMPQSFNPQRAHQYILDNAPVQHQNDYAGLWADFVDEAGPVLQSDSVYAQKDALALLRRECNVRI